MGFEPIPVQILSLLPLPLWAIGAYYSFIKNTFMKLPKVLKPLKNKLSKSPSLKFITREQAIALYSLRIIEREPEWDRAMYFAFLIISGEIFVPKDFKVIQVNYKTNELLSGTHELLGIIFSGKEWIEVGLCFPDPDNDFIIIQSTPNLYRK